MVALPQGHFSRYVTLVAGILFAVCCASNYAFSIVSPTLKKVLDYSQKDLQLVGALGNLGQYTGIFTGLVHDRFGARVTAICGTVVCSFGLLMVWGIASGHIQTNQLWLVGLVYAIGSNAQNWFDTPALITNSYNFHMNRGSIIGLQKTYNGLGAGVLSSLFQGFFKPTSIYNITNATVPGFTNLDQATLDFLFFTPLMMCAIILVTVPFINRVPDTERLTLYEGGPIIYGFGLTILVAIYLFITGILGSVFTHIPWWGTATGCGLIGTMAAYLFLPFFSSDKLWISDGEKVEVTAEERETLRMSKDNTDSSNDVKLQIPAPDFTLLEAVKTINFWILFFCLFVGMGSGLMVINNLGQIVTAVNKSPDSGSQVVFVSILSVASAAGRMTTGAASEFLKHKFSRPTFLAAQLATMTLANLLFIFVNPPILYISTFLTGFAFGSYWMLTPAILTDLFGYKSLGLIYTSIQISCVTGSFALSLGVAGSVYDHEASKSGTGVCLAGAECFAVAFYVTTGLLAVSTALSVWLVKRTEDFYFPQYLSVQE